MGGLATGIIDQPQRSSCLIAISLGMVAELGVEGQVVAVGQCSAQAVGAGSTECNRFADRLFGASNR
ncbi:hypothetical protein DE4585_00068 [Mycobacteroides salmoniphilum]|uniref:Uncharacterized protein n=1 Tax=Mycobacteroides salmoniphilum TaxID=404941 RepID=A0A4R8S5Z0_9MYCO|nr:hypothetical protein DE4585_00068 [Mycobacteroides salmoniphilum]